MDDLIAFLAARLGEDEALAKRGEEVFAIGWPDYQTFDSPELDDACKYLDRFGPARALREVSRNRSVVERHAPFTTGGYAGCSWCENEDAVPWPCPDVRDLAAIWSGHPGYRTEWKP